MHHRERYKTTNTGRIAHRALPNSRVLLRGLPNQALELPKYIVNPKQCLFLTLSEDSQDLSELKSPELSSYSELVVPDGNWRQASRMGKREALLKEMKWVKLPAGPMSSYLLRKEPTAEGLATMEAIARAFGIIEGPEVQTYLENLFNTMVQRTLKTRPKNRQDQNLKLR